MQKLSLSLSWATATFSLLLLFALLLVPQTVYAAAECNDGTKIPATVFTSGGDPNDFCKNHGGYAENTFKTGIDVSDNAPQCGKGDRAVKLSFNIGCRGENGDQPNPIVDALYAIIRFLTIGVGVVAVGSVIVAGIQYTTAHGNPQTTANAIKRITNTVGAVLLYLLIVALVEWLVPGGVFK